MRIKPLRQDLTSFLKKRNLTRKFARQSQVFVANPRHPSLNTEVLEPKNLRIYSFRVDKKYRAVFVFLTPDFIEIVDINNHYS
ncbi:MAG: hypothetical protein UU16_C0030G0002 [Candidatus Woesebacteria bacterium GW2011_GWA2_40_7]|uniref:Plasmid stabilization system n=3 Tax=Candidatus Woeseibacteriota TaxID=1752722 RepID=A0A0G0P1B7_9BACT|nr:MAG: hypothetical protein UT17_C0004G0247 [Candidatus Woesebacteria bacterium GW2011_GWB1_39_10]KKR73114.1 MAG: hypothetical protein UU16_C0030G0002 [Candidatus Woesebacteria bacterium GW2011_GWA2_40_7]KKS90890.1 MAG: hypothetical protein UV66_C0001G0247 [Candidatus Woesebacteria bacterium GW2011_GWA1_43_12]